MWDNNKALQRGTKRRSRSGYKPLPTSSIACLPACSPSARAAPCDAIPLTACKGRPPLPLVDGYIGGSQGTMPTVFLPFNSFLSHGLWAWPCEWLWPIGHQQEPREQGLDKHLDNGVLLQPSWSPELPEGTQLAILWLRPQRESAQRATWTEDVQTSRKSKEGPAKPMSHLGPAGEIQSETSRRTIQGKRT